MTAVEHLSHNQFGAGDPHTKTTAPFFSETDHDDDVACCDPVTMHAGTSIVIAPDGSAWHPECAKAAGYTVPDHHK